jgi:ABC-type nitrate/sulfonate/bicarbonate transport system substrate-binding protein
MRRFNKGVLKMILKAVLLSFGLPFGVFALQLQSVRAQTKIIQAIPTKSFGWLPLFVAQERGFYRAEGLEVIAPVMSPSTSVAALVSGEVHFAVADPAMRAAVQGAALRAVVFYYTRPTWLFIARSSIGSIGELRGKNIAIRGYGAMDDFATRKIMRAYGLTDNEYTLVPAGPDPQRIMAMAQGLVHAALLNPDAAAVAEGKLGGVKKLAVMGDYDKSPFSGFAANRKFLAGNPDIVKKFLRATVNAIMLTRNKPEEVARVAEKIFRLDAKVALSAVQNVVGAIGSQDPGGFTEEGMNEWILQNAKILERASEQIKITDVADITLLREAQRELGLLCEGGYGCSK